MSQPGEHVFDWIDGALAERERAGLRRRLRPRAADEPVLNLAGNDYLGLSSHPAVIEAAADAVRRWGAGATGSRLVTGSTEAHRALEDELAQFCGVDAALVFATGYAANLAAITALTGVDTASFESAPASGPTVLVSDAHNHASLIDGCRLARAHTVVVPHVDPDAVARALAAESDRQALVVTDSVFSVDGDLAPLDRLLDVCRAYGAALLVDDSHGLGVLAHGQGCIGAFDIAGAPDVVITASLGKSLGAQGGVVLGPRRVIDHLINTARTFIFDTGLAPASVAAARAALALIRADPTLPARARTAARTVHSGLIAAGLPATEPAAAVVSVTAPTPGAAVDWAADCLAAGLRVGCFRPPSVPDGRSRLRITARANLSEADLARAVHVLRATAPIGQLSTMD